MADPHVISALREKRALVAGLIEKLERKLEQHRADLTHVDGVLRLFQPEHDPASIKPKRTYARRTRYFARNELSRLCLGVLRTAAGELLSTDDIADRVITAKGFDAGDSILRAAIREQVPHHVNREVVDFRGDFLGAASGLGVVDDALHHHARSLDDGCAGTASGDALHVGAARPVDHRRALGLREKLIAKRRDVRIVDRGFGKPPLFFRGELPGVLRVKAIVLHAGICRRSLTGRGFEFTWSA
jgi:hypothetical protein